MKRQFVALEQIADYENLLRAVHKAARAKRKRDSVQSFFTNLESNINKLSADILAEQAPYGRYRAFEIYDPKRRWIHAACFEDRILHHAVMNVAGETLDRAMYAHSYACRKHKGVHRAIAQVQKNIRRYPYFVKIDIEAYFTKIEHRRLLLLLQRKYKGEAFLALLWRIIKSCPECAERGLPIGSLTSQYFANCYLDGLDRLLAEHPLVLGNLRYMDDVLWWCDNKSQAHEILTAVEHYLWKECQLRVKPGVQTEKSQKGVSFCGFRVYPGIIRLSRRRKHAFKRRKHHWEQQFLQGLVSDTDLQRAYAAVHAITQGADSLHWRKKQLRQHAEIEV